MNQPTCRRLRVEYLSQPLAIATGAPRFSWIADHAQTDYRVEVHDAAGELFWDSGRVASPQTALVEYAGRTLSPDADYHWKVTSWSRQQQAVGTSTFGTAVDTDRWTASWIEPVQQPTTRERYSFGEALRGAQPATPPAERLRPVRLLRQRFDLAAAPTRARFYATARGSYTAWINGARVGQEVLAPGFDSYFTRLSVQAYDVTALLQAGKNTLAAALADGWWAGRIGLTGSSAQFGERTSITWQLHLHFADGSSRIITSDRTVRSSDGPWRYADLFIGERFDARELDHGWNRPGFDDSGWEQVVDRGPAGPGLVPFAGEPVRRVTTLEPVRIQPEPGAMLVDFGQVIAGRLRLQLRDVPAGEQVTVEHSETLAADGSWFSNITGPNKDQRDVFISAGDEVFEWEPEFTFHGFRYARITGIDTLDRGEVVAVVIASDLEQTGSLQTSDTRLNQLHSNVVWSQRGNFLSIPTDCPQRERAGWTGDIQVFAPAAANNAMVAPFLSRWLQNLRADQLPDGRIPIISPRSPFDIESVDEGGLGAIESAAGWSDAVAIVPWTLYERYGDIRVLEENYPAVRAWVHWQREEALRGGIPERLAGEQLSARQRENHRRLHNTGSHFGDWLTPSTFETGLPKHEAITLSPKLTSEYIAPMFQVHSARLAARMAGVLGLAQEQEELAGYAAGVQQAFAQEYLDDRGRLPLPWQGVHALALGLDMVPGHLRQACGDELARLVRERGNRLDTGFLSTPYLLDALWDTGHRELARQVFWQDQTPSWFYAVDQGATSIWESWDSVATDGTVGPSSLNHYALGCVDDWIFRRVGGVSPTVPAWRSVRIEPDFDFGIQQADVRVDTPAGPIRVSWILEDGRAEVELALPWGIDAEFVGPTGRFPIPPGLSRHQVPLKAAAPALR
ncbi:glycoside hydrolase family 78 protein [Glutamicibacter sp. MNS18]|uniref:alpha-L-rhamnosidase n=1 Tax=Glutamicibacter sp. MNS18 TaxID=2989817 RepID=UPI0022364438|nr:alpha-L-rhamnosidase [Glutamicibacter sp. MNS18]MCW4465427.1 glycoside hydrolase family 78 protein [Glutamicibacter sp. MNS18]